MNVPPMMRILLLVLFAVPPAPAQRTQTSELRLMSFNIRYGTADDGPNSWPARKQIVFDVITSARSHAIGVQEALAFQLADIRQVFPGYRRVGVGRDDGVEAGEFSAILVDTTRLAVLDEGTFWFSDTPEIPGSMDWGNRIPRICTWVRVADLRQDQTFVIFNVHWDHESQPSREQSAALMLDSFLHLTEEDEPVVLMGDFNAGEQNSAFRKLIGIPPVPLRDAYRVSHPAATKVGTFHAFAGKTSGEKIDAILVSEHWRVLEAEIVRTNRDGRYPSDHFPVTATLRIRTGID